MLNIRELVFSNAVVVSRILIQVSTGIYVLYSVISGGLLNGVELMDSTYPGFEFLMAIQAIAGIMLVSGLFVRFGAFMLIGLFAFSLVENGLNGLDQIMLLGIGIAILAKGGLTYFPVKSICPKIRISIPVKKTISDDMFLMSIRIAFGINLIWLGFLEKIFVPDLFASVLEKYHMLPTGIDVKISVFGAGFVEIAIGIFYLLGLRQRLVSATMLCVLVFTVISFQESILAHMIMFTIPAMFVIIGSDPFTIFERSKVSSILKKVKNIVLLRMYAD